MRVASVSSRTLATDTAFSSAVRTTLVGSMMPAVDGRILRDLASGRFQGAFEDQEASALVAAAVRFFFGDGVDRAQ